LYIDGVAIGGMPELLAENRVMKLEELFNILSAKRHFWLSLNPNKVLFGNIIFWVDGRTPALVVKSALQTAALAGYPLSTFMVEDRATSKLVVVDVRADVPARFLSNDEPVQFDSYGRVITQMVFKTGELRTGPIDLRGPLSADVVQERVGQREVSVRECYEEGLRRNPSLRGQIAVRFVVEPDGKATNITKSASNLRDDDVVRCVLSTFGSLDFPNPTGAAVTVTYPIDFRPADVAGNSR
jgi:hypothetical protein